MGKGIDEITRQDEAARLTELMADAHIKNKAAFAAEHDLPGGKSLLSQHLSSTRPISLTSARAYAKALGCRVVDISPRLAALLEGHDTAEWTVKRLPKRQDPRIAKMISIMEATDDEGRIMALAAVKFALKDHKPAKKTRHAS